MKPVVLDTDVVSFLFKGDNRAERYVPQRQNRQWLISFMTEAELEQWALLAKWSARRLEWFAPVPGAMRNCAFLS
jgi:tRNA(fMet)-specific endonuclease VapC